MTLRKSFLATAPLVFIAALSAQSPVPEIPYDSAPLLKMPPHIYLGEAAGVATNSKGNIFVYTRTGASSAGAARACLSSRRVGASFAKSGRACTDFCSPTWSAWIRRTTSGWWTKVPTW